ncbi:MAG: alpha/beta hydrolase [Candidatus Dependentiae bacterium]
MVQFKNKNNMIVIGFCFVFNFFGSVFANTLTPQFENEWGKVVERVNDPVNGSQIDKILIYSPKNEETTEKIVRHGVIMHHKDAVATVVFCHGFMCDKFDIAFLCSLFPKKKFNYVLFDFRGHGENAEGQQCTLGKNEALDVISTVKFAKSHPQLINKPMIAYAFSMGAVSAIEAQAKDGSLFTGMILDCPFDSTENVLRQCLEGLRFSFMGYQFGLPGKDLLAKYVFHPYMQSLLKLALRTVAHVDFKNIDLDVQPVRPAESAAKIKVPCFFIHCKNDEKISVDAVKTVYNAVGGYKTLWLTEGRKHYDSVFYNHGAYKKNVREFAYNLVFGRLPADYDKKIIEDQDDMLSIVKKEAQQAVEVAKAIEVPS